jgi:hypothetical protein
MYHIIFEGSTKFYYSMHLVHVFESLTLFVALVALVVPSLFRILMAPNAE